MRDWGKHYRNPALCREQFIEHSTKHTFSSATTLGTVKNWMKSVFAESLTLDIKWRSTKMSLSRVKGLLWQWHIITPIMLNITVGIYSADVVLFPLTPIAEEADRSYGLDTTTPSVAGDWRELSSFHWWPMKFNYFVTKTPKITQRDLVYYRRELANSLIPIDI